VNAYIRKMKNDLLKEYDMLDIKYESGSLLPGQEDRMDVILALLEGIWNMEEVKVRQRTSDRIIKGDRNTAYFQAVANQRNRKKRITCLETDEDLIEDNDLMLNPAVEFYKNLFGLEPRSRVKLDEDFWEEEDKVTLSKNEFLEAPFTEAEIKVVVLESYAEGALAQMIFLLCSTNISRI
jgi:hypothetical protein